MKQVAKMIEPDAERQNDDEVDHAKIGIGKGEGMDGCACTHLVMCPPEHLSTEIKNNVLMKGKPIDLKRAMRQYHRAKTIIEALGVHVDEITPAPGCQDQTFVANVAVAVEPYIILSNFKAPGRSGEIAPARSFFRKLGYETIQPPYHFEGEAELKRLRDDLYFGGYGQFSDRKALEWIADTCEVEIIPIHETDATLYHLDCSVLPVDEQNVLVTVDAIDKPSLHAIEAIANVIPTPPAPGHNTTAITTCVLIPEKNICLSGAFNAERTDYVKAMEWLNDTFDKFGYTCVFLDMDEVSKSGADLSCGVMHLTF